MSSFKKKIQFVAVSTNGWTENTTEIVEKSVSMLHSEFFSTTVTVYVILSMLYFK